MRRRRAAHRPLLGPSGVALLFLAVPFLAGCGSEPSPEPTTSGLPTDPGATPLDVGGGATVDPTLLDILPGDIDGIPMTEDEETAAEIALDPTTDPAVKRLDVAVYVDPSDPVEPDLAIVSVVALEPGTFDDGWFRDWRESYDLAACEVAGGLTVGGAESDLEGHRVYIGTCRGGAHTYHVHLADPDRLIAITALGSGRFGERVVAGLGE